MLVESGALKPEHLAKAKTESEGLGLFVRALVGMERDVAKQGLNVFTAGRMLTENQIEAPECWYSVDLSAPISISSYLPG